MKRIKLLAPAKVNLYLDIVGRRPDGYHLIKTVFQTVGLYDTVEISAEEKLKPDGLIQLEVVQGARQKKTSDGSCPSGDKNIAWKAASLFLKKFKIDRPCRIRLNKEIPIQAGLGGGSSDAAAVLNGMSRIFLGTRGGQKVFRQLHELASELGADVPFFLKGGTAYASGIGEKISPLPSVKKFWLVIVKPSVGLSTPEVYGWHDSMAVKKPLKLTNLPNLNIIKNSLRNGIPVHKWSSCLTNCFEKVVFAKVPELAKIKNLLLDCGTKNALLSGSGSAMFGLVDSQEQGERVKGILRNLKAKIWVVHSVHSV